MCGPVCGYVSKYTYPGRPGKGIGHLKLEVQAVANLWAWILGTAFGSSGRAVNTLRH